MKFQSARVTARVISPGVNAPIHTFLLIYIGYSYKISLFQRVALNTPLEVLMAKSKNRKYHRPPAPKNSIQRPVRLSQCMIVKDEEKNIEKALTWAKGYAFEQIVVDTGSTDRTVEIAESMGAKVFHFTWINDFSAAKNYAIEQATGNWIAFLDADEYFTKEDVKKLMTILKNIEADPKLSKMRSALRCPIVNLDDKGKPFLILQQDRVFRNLPEIRYKGEIHEALFTNDTHFRTSDFNVIHTGYTSSAYSETGKHLRNIDMLRDALSRDPENVSLKCYLADSLRIRGETQDIAEATSLYSDALLSGQEMLKEQKQGAYNYLIVQHYDDPEMKTGVFDMCRKAYDEYPDNPDFCYYYGRKLYENKDFKEAWNVLVACENLLKGDTLVRAGFIIGNSLRLFHLMVLTAEALGNIQEIIRCATLVLKEDKYQHLILAPYIQAFNRPGYRTPADEIFALLGKLYDFNNTRDKLTVLQAAKKNGNTDLVQIVLTTFTKEEFDLLTPSSGADE